MFDSHRFIWEDTVINNDSLCHVIFRRGDDCVAECITVRTDVSLPRYTLIWPRKAALSFVQERRLLQALADEYPLPQQVLERGVVYGQSLYVFFDGVDLSEQTHPLYIPVAKDGSALSTDQQQLNRTHSSFARTMTDSNVFLKKHTSFLYTAQTDMLFSLCHLNNPACFGDTTVFTQQRMMFQSCHPHVPTRALARCLRSSSASLLVAEEAQDIVARVAALFARSIV